jgi:hypothetical protein
VCRFSRAVSESDLKDLPTLNFNVLKFHRQMDKEKEREHHLVMCLLHMFHGYVASSSFLFIFYLFYG